MKTFLRGVLAFVVLSAAALWALSALSPQPSAQVQAHSQAGQPAHVPQSSSQSQLTVAPVSVLSFPKLSIPFINRVLAEYHSPAAGKGRALYELGRKYGINSDVALAFFGHESTFGTAGEARKTRSLGNLRCIPDAECVDRERGGYAAFPTWEAGFEAWYKLIRNLYVDQWGLTTVDQIVPKYAPAADGNSEQGYVHAVFQFLVAWHRGEVRPNP